MTRALGRFAFLLLFHLILVGSGFACANPAMAGMPEMAGMPSVPPSSGHHEQSSRHTPTPSQTCTAPASCVATMAPVTGAVAAAPNVERSAPRSGGERLPVFDPAAPDTPPPRV